MNTSRNASQLIAAAVLTLGLALAPTVGLTDEKATEEGSHADHHHGKGDHTHSEGKSAKKAHDPKAQAASEKAATKPGSQHHDDDGDEDEEEGSH
jgi:hypothetical protein